MKTQIKTLLIALTISSTFLPLAIGSTTDQVSKTEGAVSPKNSTPPEVIEMPKPLYPKKLYEKKIKGEALIELIVLEDGSVTRMKVVSASHRLFGDAAKMCIEKAKFKPATINGRAVPVKIRLPVYFDPEETEKD